MHERLYFTDFVKFCFVLCPFRLHRPEEEQQVQLAAHVSVHDGRHDHPAGVRRARPARRQGADHRQAGTGPVGHRRTQEAVRRPRRQQPRVHHNAQRRRRRPLPAQPARRVRGGRGQHGVQLVHARLRGADPQYRRVIVQRHPAVNGGTLPAVWSDRLGSELATRSRDGRKRVQNAFNRPTYDYRLLSICSVNY